MTQHSREGPLRVLISGATGFIGSHICASMLGAGYRVRVIGRRSIHRSDPNLEEFLVDDLADAQAVRPAFHNVDWVVHAAGLAHQENEGGPGSLAAYRHANAATTRNFAATARGSGASAFVLVSSAVVLDTHRSHGGREQLRRKAYAQSKIEGERAVIEVLQNGPPRPIILRAPMVYGPGMKGNPLRLFRLVASGLPLPLSGIENLRSSLYVANLAAAVRFALENPEVRGKYEIDDGVPLSTPDLVKQCANALNAPTRLFYVPSAVLRGLGRVGDVINRVVHFPLTSERIESLTGSMVLDTGTGGLPGFRAPYQSAEGMHATAQWFKTTVASN